jgi:LPPG:FO 2-phospho-L-lactate transferase
MRLSATGKAGKVVILAGGTGGAKLARGMLDVVGPERLSVVVNTGDDVELYGAYVSPDPDLVSFWLADRIDARGWGIDGDSFTVMDALRALGQEIWFNLGDQDLAIGIDRSRQLADGSRLTDTLAHLGRALGVSAAVLPMSDRPVRTKVLSGGRWWSLQEYMIRHGARGEVDDVRFHGAREASATPEVLDAIANASAIVIGPSNPVISIGPILAIEQIATALRQAWAPVIAVSPLVEGKVLKGPTAAFMRHRGVPLTADGVAQLYDGLIGGIVSDEPVTAGLPSRQADLLMDSAPARERLARESLEFALSLA